MKKILGILLTLAFLSASAVFAAPPQMTVQVVDANGKSIGSATAPNSTVQLVNASGVAIGSATAPNFSVQLVSGNGTAAETLDPCSGPAAKSSAVVNVGAATTGELVAAVASKKVYVCGVYATLAGTTPTVTLLTGTKTTNPCDTSAANLSGAMAPTSGTYMPVGSGASTTVTSISSGEICATTVGTGSSFQGVISYVQQ